MPILNVQISANPDAAMTRELGEFLTGVTARTLGKKPEVTAVAIQYVPREQWLIAGVPLSESGYNSFTLEIKITDETNTLGEKARFIKEVFEGFAERFSKVHPASYVHVHDVRAAAYGYGGRTQADRFYVASGGRGL